MGESNMSRILSPPKWLPVEAQKEWRRVVPLIADRLTDSDYGVVESYVCAVAKVQQCQVILNREGLIIESESGPKSHPACRMQQQATISVRALAAELGLSPKSRRHSSGPAEPESNDWAGLAS